MADIDDRWVPATPTDGADGLDAVSTPSLSSVVFQSVRAAIIDKSIPPGSRLTEASLAARLDTSKTPVRETLLRLRQIGLVEPVGRRGYRVIRPSREAIEQAYEVREALEGMAAGVAADRASTAERTAMREAAACSLTGALDGDLAMFRRWDEEFHGLVAAATRNPRLQAVIDDSADLVVTLRSRDLPYAQASVECGKHHEAIAAAIARGDRPGAEAAMRDHIRQVSSYVLGDRWHADADAADVRQTGRPA